MTKSAFAFKDRSDDFNGAISVLIRSHSDDDLTHGTARVDTATAVEDSTEVIAVPSFARGRVAYAQLNARNEGTVATRCPHLEGLLGVVLFCSELVLSVVAIEGFKTEAKLSAGSELNVDLDTAVG